MKSKMYYFVVGQDHKSEDTEGAFWKQGRFFTDLEKAKSHARSVANNATRAILFAAKYDVIKEISFIPFEQQIKLQPQSREPASKLPPAMTIKPLSLLDGGEPAPPTHTSSGNFIDRKLYS